MSWGVPVRPSFMEQTHPHHAVGFLHPAAADQRSDDTSSSCATVLSQSVRAGAVQQQARVCSQQQLLKLELLQILVDMRMANRKGSEQLEAAMAETDKVLQSGMRALELANRVLAINGPSWVADRALTAAEIAMSAAVQRLNQMNGMVQQQRAASAAAWQTRADNWALNGSGAPADDAADDELEDTCCSILQDLNDVAAV